MKLEFSSKFLVCALRRPTQSEMALNQTYIEIILAAAEAFSIPQEKITILTEKTTY